MIVETYSVMYGMLMQRSHHIRFTARVKLYRSPHKPRKQYNPNLLDADLEINNERNLYTCEVIVSKLQLITN